MTPTDIEHAVEKYLAKPYPIVLIPDDGEWVVAIPDLQGCISQGATVAEAMEMIRDAQRAWLTVSLQNGAHIPEPSAPATIWTMRRPASVREAHASVAG